VLCAPRWCNPPSESSNTTNPLNLGDDVANLLIILEDSISAGFLYLEDLRNREKAQHYTIPSACSPLPLAFAVCFLCHRYPT